MIVLRAVGKRSAGFTRGKRGKGAWKKRWFAGRERLAKARLAKSQNAGGGGEAVGWTLRVLRAGSKLRRTGRKPVDAAARAAPASTRSVLGRVILRAGLVEVGRILTHLRFQFSEHKIARAGKHGERQIPEKNRHVPTPRVFGREGPESDVAAGLRPHVDGAAA
jgi:hypothetical protein